MSAIATQVFCRRVYNPGRSRWDLVASTEGVLLDGEHVLVKYGEDQASVAWWVVPREEAEYQEYDDRRRADHLHLRDRYRPDLDEIVGISVPTDPRRAAIHAHGVWSIELVGEFARYQPVEQT